MPLGSLDDYQQYDINLAKIEDDLFEQTSIDSAKLYLQQLLSEWKTTTEYDTESTSLITDKITTPKSNAIGTKNYHNGNTKFHGSHKSCNSAGV